MKIDSTYKSARALDSESVRFGLLLHCTGLFVAVLCAVAGYSWLYAPTNQTIAETAERIRELRRSVDNAPSVRREHAKLSERLQEFRTQIAELQGRVPAKANAGDFLRHVSQIAREENLDISNFRPEKPARQDGFEALEVMLTGSGSFESVCTFFDRLDKLPRLSKVKHLSLKVAELGDELPMSATLVIYFGLEGKTQTAPQEVHSG